MIASVIDLKNGLTSCDTNGAAQGPAGHAAEAPAVNNKDQAATQSKRRDSFIAILLRSLSAVAV